jgi:hypothetical protein
MNTGHPNDFTIFGVQPGASQWSFFSRLVSIGGQFTGAGQKTINALYPNLSVFWMWDKSRKLVMR